MKASVLVKLKHFFNGRRYLLVDGKWTTRYQRNKKIESVYGSKANLLFCTCGNELMYSNSLLQIFRFKKNHIWKYQCTYCNKRSYFRQDLGPIALPCNKLGELKND